MFQIGVAAGFTATSPELLEMQPLSMVLSGENIAEEDWKRVLGTEEAAFELIGATWYTDGKPSAVGPTSINDGQ